MILLTLGPKGRDSGNPMKKIMGGQPKQQPRTNQKNGAIVREENGAIVKESKNRWE
jgi:hypothetical protein